MAELFKKCVLFDLDGTLLKSMDVWAEIDKKFFDKRNLPLPNDYMDITAVLDIYRAADYTIQRFGLNEHAEDIINEWKDEAIYQYTHNVKLFDYALEYLQTLKAKGLRLAIVTSGDRSIFEWALKSNNIEGLFDLIVSASGLPYHKGDGSLYKYTLGLLNVAVEDCVLFEDAFPAIQSGKKLGFDVVAVKSPHSSVDEDTLKEYADFIIDDYSQAPTINLKK